MNRFNVINVEKRSEDWLAIFNGDRSKWESGATEAEAVGKIVIRFQLMLDIEVRK